MRYRIGPNHIFLREKALPLENFGHVRCNVLDFSNAVDSVSCFFAYFPFEYTLEVSADTAA